MENSIVILALLIIGMWYSLNKKIEDINLGIGEVFEKAQATKSAVNELLKPKAEPQNKNVKLGFLGKEIIKALRNK